VRLRDVWRGHENNRNNHYEVAGDGATAGESGFGQHIEQDGPTRDV